MLTKKRDSIVYHSKKKIFSIHLMKNCWHLVSLQTVTNVKIIKWLSYSDKVSFFFLNLLKINLILQIFFSFILKNEFNTKIYTQCYGLAKIFSHSHIMCIQNIFQIYMSLIHHTPLLFQIEHKCIWVYKKTYLYFAFKCLCL